MNEYKGLSKSHARVLMTHHQEIEFCCEGCRMKDYGELVRISSAVIQEIEEPLMNDNKSEGVEN